MLRNSFESNRVYSTTEIYVGVGLSLLLENHSRQRQLEHLLGQISEEYLKTPSLRSKRGLESFNFNVSCRTFKSNFFLALAIAKCTARDWLAEVRSQSTNESDNALRLATAIL
jgi:hypothetical protein